MGGQGVPQALPAASLPSESQGRLRHRSQANSVNDSIDSPEGRTAKYDARAGRHECTPLTPGLNGGRIAPMQPVIKIAVRILLMLAAAFAMMFFGFLTSQSAFRILGEWSSISRSFASAGLLFAFGGPAMMVGGLWALVSLGRHRIPLWIGGVASALVGIVLVVGTLTNVIPCSGPD